MKKVYVCGDSFAVSDPGYGACWVDLLRNQLSATAELIVLARVAASNTHIALQLDRAMHQGADFIIWLATSSVRYEARLGEVTGDLLDNFVDATTCEPNALANYSASFLRNNLVFAPQDNDMLLRYLINFSCLELDVYKNELIIEAAHARLNRCGVPYIFDQGGFEHASFGGTAHYEWPNQSALCLWDYVDKNMPLRPYYHIMDQQRHQDIADYYQCQINQYL